MPKKAAALFMICVSLATWISCAKTSSHFLYAAIPAGNEIVAYREDPNSGVLTAFSFSPIAAGLSVQSLVLNPSNTFMYAANAGGPNISLWAIASDGSLSEQGQRTTTDADPTVVAIDPAGAYLYVLNSGAGDITVFSIASSDGTLSQIGTGVPLGLTVATNMLLASSGDVLYVTGQGSLGGVVEVFSVSAGSLTFVGSFATGTFPNGMAISSSGSYLYVANSGSDNISEYSIASDGSLSPLTGSPLGEAYLSPTSLLIDKSGKYLYVANEGSSNVAAYSIGSDGSLTLLTNSPFATGSQPSLIASDPNGEWLFVGNQSTAVIQSFGLASGSGTLTSVESYSVPGTPTSIVVVP